MREIASRHFTSHESRVSIQRASAFLAAKTARGMFSHFVFLMRKLYAVLGELLSSAVFKISQEWVFVEFRFHVGLLLQLQASGSLILCL